MILSWNSSINPPSARWPWSGGVGRHRGGKIGADHGEFHGLFLEERHTEFFSSTSRNASLGYERFFAVFFGEGRDAPCSPELVLVLRWRLRSPDRRSILGAGVATLSSARGFRLERRRWCRRRRSCRDERIFGGMLWSSNLRHEGTRHEGTK